MIDPTTLPLIPAGSVIEFGQQFTIRGNHFNGWPEEIVLGYAEEILTENPVPSHAIMILKERTDTTLTFEATQGNTYGSEHLWSLFATPKDPTRSILSYKLME